MCEGEEGVLPAKGFPLIRMEMRIEGLREGQRFGSVAERFRAEKLRT